MQNTFYTCGMCGRVLPGRSSSCPFCGACFSGVHCRNCGYTGAGSEFAGDVCPGCGRNPFTGARPGRSKPGQADGSMVAVGCGVPAGIGLLAFGILAGTSSGCAAVSIVAGLILILVPLGFRFLGKASERDAPRNRTYGKTGEEEPLPVFRTPPSPGPCPFPAYPRNGWKDPVSGGFFIPHGWSWDAGVGRAGSGITRFIVSGDMCGSMTYAHFEKSGSGWKVRIDDSLP